MKISGRPASAPDARQIRARSFGTATLGLTILLALPGLQAQQSTLLAEGTKALYQNDLARSEALAAQLLKKRPRDADGMVLLARAEMAQGKLDLAFETLAMALRTQPRHVDALYYLGRLSLLLSPGQFEALLDMAPNSARSHQVLAEEAESRDDLSKAEEEYQAALRLDPKSVDVLNALGLIHQRKFKFNEASDYYSKAAAIQPRNFDSLYGLGSCHLYLQQPERAAEVLRQAVAADPQSSAAYFALGDALLRLGQDQEAVANLQASLKIAPDRRQTYVLLARAYRRLGKVDEANKALAKTVELTQQEREKRADVLGSDNADLSAPTPGGDEEVTSEQ